MPTLEPSRRVLQAALREVYQGPAWHGASLLATLKTLSPAAARRWPGRGRNSIWELVLHLAYTRHRMLRRLGALTGRFPRPLRAAWWPRFPADPSAAQWARDLALLADYQARLVAATARVPASRLRARRKGQPRSLAYELLGVTLHDAYHTGQIRLLQRLRAGS